jgi:hypothetical protein
MAIPLTCLNWTFSSRFRCPLVNTPQLNLQLHCTHSLPFSFSIDSVLYYIEFRSGPTENTACITSSILVWRHRVSVSRGCSTATVVRVTYCNTSIAAALRRADPPTKESYQLCIGLRNWKSSQGPKGCRAIERKKTIIAYRFPFLSPEYG